MSAGNPALGLPRCTDCLAVRAHLLHRQPRGWHLSQRTSFQTQQRCHSAWAGKLPCYVQRHAQDCWTTGRSSRQRRDRLWCKAGIGEDATTVDGSSPQVAMEGDTVVMHYTCFDEAGQQVDSSREREEPVTFLVGAGEVFGNKLFQAFDAAVRGMALGDTTVLEASGGEWQRDLLFTVPYGHEEMQMLEKRYKNVGGLKPGLVVELSNGSNAVLLEVNDDIVKLDANNMLAGKKLRIELELVSIEQGV